MKPPSLSLVICTSGTWPGQVETGMDNGSAFGYLVGKYKSVGFQKTMK